MDMFRCGKCGTFHYGNDPCPDYQPVQTPAKMSEVMNAFETLKGMAEIVNVTTTDNLMSSLFVRGSFDPKGTWLNGIWENSRHFHFHVTPQRGRYYEAGQNVTAELIGKGQGMPNFRKYSGTPEKVAKKIAGWLKQAAWLS